MKHVAVLMGGWSAERPVSLKSGTRLRRRAGSARLPRHARRCRPRHRRGARHAQARRRVQRPARTLRRGRRRSRASWKSCEFLTPIPACWPPPWRCARTAPRSCSPPPAFPSPESVTVDRHEAARGHVLAPPYVLKPVSEGSSFGVVIVKADRTHPPQEVGREDWPYGDELLCRTLRRRQGTDLRRDGRPGARRHRGPPGVGGLLRLRREICERRLDSCASRRN